jgi:DNA-binding transcriptional LysR family regulator
MRNNIYLNNLPALVVFATVVDKGNLTRAAEELFCSKTAVSRHISNLEERIGFKLLHRTTRRVTLTSQGKELYNCCANIIRSMDEANLLIDGIISEPRGELRITAPLAFTLLKTKEVIADFLKTYNQVSVDLTLLDHPVDILSEGFDVALWLGEPYDRNLMKLRLRTFKNVICASPAYFEKNGSPQNLDELLEHNCIQKKHINKIASWTLSPDSVVSVRGNRLKSNSGRMAREAALADLGIAYLPSYLVEDDIAAGSLIPVLDEFVKIDLPLYILYPSSHQHMAKVRSFVDFCKARNGG